MSPDICEHADEKEDPLEQSKKFLKSGDVDSAASYAEIAISSDPRDAEAWLVRGDCHAQACDGAEARRCWEEALSLTHDGTIARKAAEARLDRPDRYVVRPVRRLEVSAEKLPRPFQPRVEIFVDGKKEMSFKAGGSGTVDICEGHHSILVKAGRGEKTYGMRVSGKDARITMRTIKKENRWDVDLEYRSPTCTPEAFMYYNYRYMYA